LALIYPSYREKRRYLLVKAEEGFEQRFIDKFIYFFGIYGLAKAGIQFVKDLCNEDTYVIRVSRKYTHYAIVVSHLAGGELLGVFPTLRKLKEFANKKL